MKRILVFIIFMTFLLVGCSSDTDYIETVKGIPIEEILKSSTTEELAANIIKKATNSQNITTSSLKWSIEGNTENGKVVIAEYEGNKVYFQTIKNGDYIQYYPKDVYIITKNKKRVTLFEMEYDNILDDLSKEWDF